MTQENNLPAPIMTFEERMRARIRESIGELMSDEDLAKIVDRGLEEVFFQPRGKGGYNQEPRPPLIHDIVRDVLGLQVQKEVAYWVQTHNDEVKEILKQVLEEGVGLAVMSALKSMFANDLMTLGHSIENRLRNT